MKNRVDHRQMRLHLYICNVNYSFGIKTKSNQFSLIKEYSLNPTISLMIRIVFFQEK